MTMSETPLPSLLSKVVDNRGRSCPTAPEGFPLIATNCIRRDLLYPTFENLRYVDDETYSTWFRGHPEPGDIIFVCKGDPGRTALVPDPVPFAIAQDMVALRPERSRISGRYLLYALRSSLVQERIRNMHVGTMIPHFKKGDFGKLLVPVHDSLREQQAISEVLGALDDKIAANATLISTADELLWSEFHAFLRDGELTERATSDVATVALGGTPSRARPEFWTNGTVPWLNSGELNAARILKPSALITEEALSKSAAKMMPPGATLIAITGATLGKISRLEIAASGNQSIVGVWGDSPLMSVWLFCALRARRDQLLTRATGAAQQHVSKADVAQLQIPVAAPKTLWEFGRRAMPLLDLATNAERESATLVATRDTLLPHLMSGKLRVRDAEATVSAVGV